MAVWNLLSISQIVYQVMWSSNADFSKCLTCQMEFSCRFHWWFIITGGGLLTFIRNCLSWQVEIFCRFQYLFIMTGWDLLSISETIYHARCSPYVDFSYRLSCQMGLFRRTTYQVEVYCRFKKLFILLGGVHRSTSVIFYFVMWKLSANSHLPILKCPF